MDSWRVYSAVLLQQVLGVLLLELPPSRQLDVLRVWLRADLRQWGKVVSIAVAAGHRLVLVWLVVEADDFVCLCWWLAWRMQAIVLHSNLRSVFRVRSPGMGCSFRVFWCVLLAGAAGQLSFTMHVCFYPYVLLSICAFIAFRHIVQVCVSLIPLGVPEQ